MTNHFGLNCPSCNAGPTMVIDSRVSCDGRTCRRRKECQSCRHRFTTYEASEQEGERVQRIVKDLAEMRTLAAALSKQIETLAESVRVLVPETGPNRQHWIAKEGQAA